MKKKALITGITGQDGSYLAELLLDKGYTVFGLTRRSSSPNHSRIYHLLCDPMFKQQLILQEGELTDANSLKKIIEQSAPDEVYNLAAMSHVKTSFEVPKYTIDVDGIGVLHLLEAIRQVSHSIRFYQASTSELYGKVREIPQTEETPFHPRSPYGVAKLYAYWITVNYREAYGLHASNGILFNHESPRRGETFVSRKITLAVARIAHGLQQTLVLGNLDAKRDWGYAKDFVEGMWKILQQDTPGDYVLATGATTTVRAFVELAFLQIGVEVEWLGRGIEEKGYNKSTKQCVVEVSPELFRPAEVELLIGDSSKAEKKLGWKSKTTIKELIEIMVQSDLKIVANAHHLESLV